MMGRQARGGEHEVNRGAIGRLAASRVGREEPGGKKPLTPSAAEHSLLVRIEVRDEEEGNPSALARGLQLSHDQAAPAMSVVPHCCNELRIVLKAELVPCEVGRVGDPGAPRALGADERRSDQVLLDAPQAPTKGASRRARRLLRWGGVSLVSLRLERLTCLTEVRARR